MSSLNGPGQSHRITLVTREGCHLCEDAREIVRRVAAETGAGFTVTDVDDDPGLPSRYTELVPVLLVDGKELDYWRIDEQRLRRALAPRDEPGHGTGRWFRRWRGR